VVQDRVRAASRLVDYAILGDQLIRLRARLVEDVARLVVGVADDVVLVLKDDSRLGDRAGQEVADARDIFETLGVVDRAQVAEKRLFAASDLLFELVENS